MRWTRPGWVWLDLRHLDRPIRYWVGSAGAFRQLEVDIAAGELGPARLTGWDVEAAA